MCKVRGCDGEGVRVKGVWRRRVWRPFLLSQRARKLTAKQAECIHEQCQ